MPCKYPKNKVEILANFSKHSMPFSFAVLSLSEYIIHLRVENEKFSAKSAEPER
jgi:hypothetical protein